MTDSGRSIEQKVAELEQRSRRIRSIFLIGTLVIVLSLVAVAFYLNGLRAKAEQRAEVSERKANSLADTLELARQAYEAGDRAQLEKQLKAAITKSEQLAQSAGLDVEAPASAAAVTPVARPDEPTAPKADSLAGPRPRPTRDGPRSDKSAAEPAETGVATRPQRVFIQFAGRIAREDIVAFNRALRSQGWRVQGPSGERTASSIGVNEVRYSAAKDRPAAEALAAAANGAGLAGAPVAVKRVGIIRPNTLELWISN